MIQAPDENALVYELASRTLYNLEHGCFKYEVTQLLNSLTGLLIFPQQHFKRYLDDTCKRSYASFVSEGWPNVQIDWKTATNSDFPEILRHLRNSVAHYRFILENGNSGIERITFHDRSSKKSSNNWEATFTVDELRLFVKSLARLIRTIALENSIIKRLEGEAVKLKGTTENTPWTTAYKTALSELAGFYEASTEFQNNASGFDSTMTMRDFAVLFRANWSSGNAYMGELEAALQRDVDLRIIIYDAQLRKFGRFNSEKEAIANTISDGLGKRFLLLAHKGSGNSEIKHHAWFS